MSIYSHDFIVHASKDRVISLITDPFLLSGVFGHINILQVYDKKEGKYVTPSSLSSPSNKFLVIYIFGTPDTRMSFFEGEMEGAIYTVEGVTYRGWTKGKKFTWEMRIQIKNIRPMETNVRIILTTEYKLSGLDKILGKTPFALAKHIVEDHIRPYLKYYLKTESRISIEDITPIKLFEKEGVFSQILPELTKASGNVEYGIIVVKGADISGELLIKNGRITKINVNYKGKEIQGQEGIFELLSLPSIVKITLYTVNIDEILMIRFKKHLFSNNSQ